VGANAEVQSTHVIRSRQSFGGVGAGWMEVVCGDVVPSFLCVSSASTRMPRSRDFAREKCLRADLITVITRATATDKLAGMARRGRGCFINYYDGRNAYVCQQRPLRLQIPCRNGRSFPGESAVAESRVRGVQRFADPLWLYYGLRPLFLPPSPAG